MSAPNHPFRQAMPGGTRCAVCGEPAVQHMNHPFVELVGSSGTRTWAANQQALAHALAEEFSGMSPADPSQVPVAGVFDMNRMAANLITRLGLPAE